MEVDTRRTGSLSLMGTPFLLCVFFAANPEEELQTSDIALKFGVTHRSVISGMTAAIRIGLIERTRGSSRWRQSTYRAGPKLREMVGQ